MTPEQLAQLEHLVEKTTTVLVAAAVALGLPKFWSRVRRNGHARPVVLAAGNLEKWQADVDEELEKFQREIFEPDGSLRRGDHNLRNEVQRMLSEAQIAVTGSYKDLKTEVRQLSTEVHALALEVAARGNCCEHCKDGD